MAIAFGLPFFEVQGLPVVDIALLYDQVIIQLTSFELYCQLICRQSLFFLEFFLYFPYGVGRIYLQDCQLVLIVTCENVQAPSKEVELYLEINRCSIQYAIGR